MRWNLVCATLRVVASPAGAVDHKDVILAVLGVSAGLAGLVLVFLGLVVTTYRSFQAPTPAPVLKPYRDIAALVLGAFVIGMACVIVATAWLIRLQDHHALYVAAVLLFGGQIVALLVATGATVYRLVWAH